MVHQNKHYMQSPAWAKIKAKQGWKSEIVEDLGISQPLIVYRRKVPLLGNFLYIPGMPSLSSSEIERFTSFLKAKYKRQAFLTRIEQSSIVDEDLVNHFINKGWNKAKLHIQYRHTVIVNLKPQLDDIWMNLKSRGRYEITKAEQSGVQVTRQDVNEESLEKMYDLLTMTSERNKFFIRDKKFMLDYWQTLNKAGQLLLFFASHKNEVLAAAVVITSGDTAWYKEGASTRSANNLMAPRFLQWEIIKHLKKTGITTYDLGGIPDPAKHQTSSMHGVYVFKSAYAKETVAFMPTLDLDLKLRGKIWPLVEKNWLRVFNLFRHTFWY